MNSEYSNNPLTEVALALSMAFFSIMVLTIFALSHSSKTANSNEKISISPTSLAKKKENKNRDIIFYFEDNFYNKNMFLLLDYWFAVIVGHNLMWVS